MSIRGGPDSCGRPNGGGGGGGGEGGGGRNPSRRGMNPGLECDSSMGIDGPDSTETPWEVRSGADVLGSCKAGAGLSYWRSSQQMTEDHLRPTCLY
jgi:hypothetical protein